MSSSSPGPTAVERVAAAVRGCVSVADLHPGPFGAVATYLPGRRVGGIRVAGDPTDPARFGLVEVHVAGRYPVPVLDIAREVRAAIAGPAPGLEVVVTVEDYV